MQPTEQQTQPEFETVHSTYRTSATVGKLYSAIAKAQKELRAASKDAKNPDKNSRYASLASVIDAATEAYSNNGVAILQPPTASGSVVSITTILAFDEEWFESTLDLQAMVMRKGGVFETMLDPQSIGSAITYARRYALASTCLISQDDDDGEKASKAAKEAAAQAAADKEAASMFGEAPKSADAPPPVAKAEDFKKLNKKSPEKAQASADLANKRIAEEQAKLDATIAGPPASAQERLEWFLSNERTKYQHWDEFARIKADMIEVLGDEGEPKYYEILGGFNVKKSNEFKNRADSVAAYKMMLDVVTKAMDAPVATSIVGAEDDWLPGVIGKAVAA